MKSRILLLLATIMTVIITATLSAQAQSWVIGGNSVAADAALGTRNYFAVKIITNLSEKMRVTPSGNVGIGTTLPIAKLNVVNGTDVAPTGGGFIIAGTGTTNIGIDDNEIMARSNGKPSTLFLNHNGGNVAINGLGSPTGYLGVGTYSPVSDFHLVHQGGAATHGLMLQQKGNGYQWKFYSYSSGSLMLHRNGVLKGAFNGSGFYSASDKRLKKDFEKVTNVLPKIMQLDVQKYHFTDAKPGDLKQYGMIAQDVEKVFPEVVDHIINEDGSGDVYAMNYNVFGVLAVRAIQEQQKKIEEQDKKINELTVLVNKLLNAPAAGGHTNEDVKTSVSNHIAGNLSAASLEQNSPNPFNGTTLIRYHLPSDAGTAQLVISDSKGAIVKRISLNGKGAGQITVDANSFAAGTYSYNIWINGKKTSAKQMIIAR